MPFPEKISGYFLPLQEPGKGRANREADREKAETGEREKDPNARYYSERSDRLCCCPASRQERLIQSFRKLQHFCLSGSQSEAGRIGITDNREWQNKCNVAKEETQRCENFYSVNGCSVCTPVSEKSVLIFALETGGRPRQNRFSRAHE